MNDQVQISSDILPAVRQMQALLSNLENTPNQFFAQATAAKNDVLARYQPIFSYDNIPKIAKEEFKSFLLFENNQHWSGLHRQGGYITADMDLLREALRILVDENLPIKDRMNRLITKSGPMVPRLGRAVLTAILLVSHPDRYGVWNSTSEAGLKALGIWPKFDRGALFGDRYVAVNQVLNTLAEALNVDLWTLDALLWHAIRKPTEDKGDQEEESIDREHSQQRFGLERYLHNFLRDNWDHITYFKEWSLYEVDGEQVGYEYITPIGRIDLLAKHNIEPKWLVIELKRDQSNDTTVGQVLRYMGWLVDNLAEPGEEVHGLIISHASDEKLTYALKFANNVNLIYYEVDFRLREV